MFIILDPTRPSSGGNERRGKGTQHSHSVPTTPTLLLGIVSRGPSRTTYQVLTPRGNDRHVSGHVCANHGFHVLNLAEQVGHCHGVEVGVSDFQGGLEGAREMNVKLPGLEAGKCTTQGSEALCLTMTSSTTRESCLLNVTFTTLRPLSSTRTECGNRKKKTKPDARRQSRTDRRTYCLL